MKARTMVFVHGMYMTPLCWDTTGTSFPNPEECPPSQGV